MKHERRKLGDIGEIAARDYLVGRRFSIIAANYAKPYGEIDIIAKKDGIIHFIEVKTSKFYPDTAFPPEIRINPKKVRNLTKICETYLRETRTSEDQHWQIDVISVILGDDRKVMHVEFFENAIFGSNY